MSSIPSRAATRIATAIKRFQPILESAKNRDVNESDTVVVVTDMLSELFGFDKYSEVTSEHAIRGTYCDIAIKLDGKLSFLIEVKSAGSELKDQHVKQAVDYAANQGVEWVVLTNGVCWRAYRIGFSKPITNDLVLELNMLALHHRKGDDIEQVFLLSREGWNRAKLGEYGDQKEAVSRYSIAAIALSDPVIRVIRRELRRLSPKVKVTDRDIRAVLENEVVKRDAIEGDRAAVARKAVARANGKSPKRTEAQISSLTVQPVIS
jgi:hypothetical protein